MRHPILAVALLGAAALTGRWAVTGTAAHACTCASDPPPTVEVEVDGVALGSEGEGDGGAIGRPWRFDTAGGVVVVDLAVSGPELRSTCDIGPEPVPGTRYRVRAAEVDGALSAHLCNGGSITRVAGTPSAPTAAPDDGSDGVAVPVLAAMGAAAAVAAATVLVTRRRG